jgi:hypothetical protein
VLVLSKISKVRLWKAYFEEDGVKEQSLLIVPLGRQFISALFIYYYYH